MINKSLYPLHLRRGAVSPASFSLKSASTASSLNALPRGYNELYNALSGKGPIILLSDQASMQSLCSINSRMTCSCSSLRSAGSDGTQVTPTGADGIGARAESDGSFVYSPTDKVDGTQITLSVPVECHGKRKDSSDSRKETECNYVKCETDTTESETNQNDVFAPVELETVSNERMAGNMSGCISSPVDYYATNRSPVPASNDGQSVIQNNSSWHSGQVPALDVENAPDMDNTPREFCQNINNLPFERDHNIDASEITFPVKPVPVIGRAVSAYSIMEYNIGKDTLPSNSECQPVHDDSTQLGSEENGPKRRHSAFTPCCENSSSIKRRKGRLSTGCMKEHVSECEPLINGNVVRAHLSEDEEDIFSSQSISDESNQGGKRLRKSGLSVCYSPTNFIQPPLWDEGDNLNEETGIEPLNPCSSNSDCLNNGSACGRVPIINIQYENYPEQVRTSRV